VYDSAEPCFALHDDVGYSHLTTQGGEEDDELDGVDIMGDDTSFSLSAAVAATVASRRAFFSCFDSRRYLLLKKLE
jgi:hypothetical protein